MGLAIVADLAHARLGHRRAQRAHHPLGRLGLIHVRNVHRPHVPCTSPRPSQHEARPRARASVHAQWWQQRGKLPPAPPARATLQQTGLRLSTRGCRRRLDAEVLVVHHDVAASRWRGRVARAAPRAREPRRQRATRVGARRVCVPRRVRVPRQQAGGEHETAGQHPIGPSRGVGKGVKPRTHHFDRTVAPCWRGAGVKLAD